MNERTEKEEKARMIKAATGSLSKTTVVVEKTEVKSEKNNFGRSRATHQSVTGDH